MINFRELYMSKNFLVEILFWVINLRNRKKKREMCEKKYYI